MWNLQGVIDIGEEIDKKATQLADQARDMDELVKEADADDFHAQCSGESKPAYVRVERSDS